MLIRLPNGLLMRQLFTKSDGRKLDLLKEAHDRQRVLAVHSVAWRARTRSRLVIRP
jgi:hypothetical protein